VNRGAILRHASSKPAKWDRELVPDPKSLDDFWLKQPVIDLIEAIREVGDGEILSISVMHGLPHLIEIHHRADL
jgi:hypothetical protein